MWASTFPKKAVITSLVLAPCSLALSCLLLLHSQCKTQSCSANIKGLDSWHRSRKMLTWTGLSLKKMVYSLLLVFLINGRVTIQIMQAESSMNIWILLWSNGYGIIMILRKPYLRHILALRKNSGFWSLNLMDHNQSSFNKVKKNMLLAWGLFWNALISHNFRS